MLGAIHGGYIAAEEINRQTVTSSNNNEIITKELEKQMEQYAQWKDNQTSEYTSSYTVEEELASIMNNAMGIYRNEETLREAMGQIEQLENEKIYSHESYYEYVLIKSLIHLSKAFLISAINRKESRGAHQRIEYPEKSDKYRKTTVIQEKNNEMIVSFNDTDEKMGW